MKFSYVSYPEMLAVLGLFPMVFILFATMKPARAAAFTALIGAFYLPEWAHIKIPMTPMLGKPNLPYLVGTLAAFLLAGRQFFKNKPLVGPEAISLLMIASNQMTARTNTDPLVYGSWLTLTLPGMNYKDGFALGLDHVFKWCFSLMLGRLMFRTKEDLVALAKVFTSILVVYTALIAVELKMSPQVNYWVYGYFPHSDFMQVFRWGGYRPQVFWLHGLNMTINYFVGLMLAVGFLRARYEIYSSVKLKHVVIYLAVMLFLCKSTGAIMFMLICLPLLLKAKIKTVVRVAQTLVVVLVVYPWLRANQWVPVDTILDYVTLLSPERAASLEFRFMNEGMLLDKAQERFYWGWGSYGRNGIYHEEMGNKEISVADGTWIILLSINGVMGMLIGLVPGALSVFLAGNHILRIRNEQHQWMLAGLLLGVAFGLFDLIPNSLQVPLRLFFAGAVLAVASYMAKHQSGEDSAPIPGKNKRKKRRKRRRVAAPPIPNMPPSLPDEERLFAAPGPSYDESVLFGDRDPPAGREAEDQLFAPSPDPDATRPPGDELFVSTDDPTAASADEDDTDPLGKPLDPHKDPDP